MSSIINDRFIDAAGAMLLHSLWQLSLSCLLLAGLVYFFRKRSAALRYRLAVIVQLSFLLAALITFCSYYKTDLSNYGSAQIDTTTAIYQSSTDPAGISALKEHSNTEISWTLIAVLTWIAGMLVFSLRLAGGWFWLRKLKLTAEAASNQWSEISVNISGRLNLRRHVNVMESARVHVPLVMGFLKPVILLPVAAVNQLSLSEVEAILAHELAHIKRSDYLVNLFQSVAEMLFFFHPGMYWINAVIRCERENCCDDLAVSLHGSPLPLARALERLASYQAESGTLALAAIGNGGKPLLDRIRSILVPGASRLLPERSLSLGIMTLALMFLAFAGISNTSAYKNLEPIIEAAIPGNMNFLWNSAEDGLAQKSDSDTTKRKKVIVISSDHIDSVYVDGKKQSRTSLKKDGKTEYLELDAETAKQITIDYFRFAAPEAGENAYSYEFRTQGDSGITRNFKIMRDLGMVIAPFPAMPAFPPMSPMPPIGPISPIPPMAPTPPMPSFDKNLSRKEKERLEAEWEKNWSEYQKEFDDYNREMDEYNREMDMHNKEMDMHNREMDMHNRDMDRHSREMEEQIRIQQQITEERRTDYNPEEPERGKNDGRFGSRYDTREVGQMLLNDKLISDIGEFTFELDGKDMKVNGVRQPDAVAARYRKSLFKGASGSIRIQGKN